ncbi:MAG: hypothetical protein ACRC4N_09805, partial [Gammaproteobacteria bacterium]
RELTGRILRRKPGGRAVRVIILDQYWIELFYYCVYGRRTEVEAVLKEEIVGKVLKVEKMSERVMTRS